MTPDAPRKRGESESLVAVVASIVANVAIAATKLIVAAISHSTAMLAEGLHSLVNCSDGALLLLGAHRSRRPPDESHPFGYTREAFFWSLIVGVLFFVLGGGFSAYEGVRQLLHPSPLGDPKWNYAVLGVAALFDGSSFVIGFRRFRKQSRGKSPWAAVRETKNTTLLSVVLEDVADIVGLLLAFLGVFLSHQFDLPIFDGLAAIGVGLVLLTTATILLVEIHSLLIGESADPDFIRALRVNAGQDEKIRWVARPMTVQIGPGDVFVALEVELVEGLSGEEVVQVLDRLERRIKKAHPEVRHAWLQPTAAETQPSAQRG